MALEQLLHRLVTAARADVGVGDQARVGREAGFLQRPPVAGVTQGDGFEFGRREREVRNALMAEVDRHQPALVVLAGFMRILTPGFVAHYAGRIVNIHPSLLPAFPGLHTHQRAIDMGCRVAGVTVHQVTAELDHGAILAQAVVPVLPDDTADTLAARVLTQEHLIYPRAVAELILRV